MAVALLRNILSLWTIAYRNTSHYSPNQSTSRLKEAMNEPLLSRTNTERSSLDEQQNNSTIDPESQRWTPYSSISRQISESVSDSGSESGKRTRVNPKIVSDAILGLSDGLTVPFALSAGLSAFGDTKVVVLGSLAELVAGAISMGLGGYVGAKSEVESYQTTERETQQLMKSSPSETMALVREVFAPFNIPEEAVAKATASLRSSPESLKTFLLTFYHKQAEPNCNQAWISAITLALGYFIGGFIPLIPYFIVDQVITGLYYSIAVMGITLLVFGYIKTCIVRGWRGSENVIAGIKGGIQMVIVGGLAAGAAIALVRAIDAGKS